MEKKNELILNKEEIKSLAVGIMVYAMISFCLGLLVGLLL